MSENDRGNVQDICKTYKELPPYLRGKIDGYAEAIKEKKSDMNPQPTANKGK